LIFIDDDVEVAPGWLAGMVRGFSENRVDIVGGPSIPSFGGSVPDWFWDFILPTPYGGWYCTWVSLLDIGRPVHGINPNFVWTLNFGIKRSVFRDLGGFHPDLVPSHLERWQGDGETGLTLKAQALNVKAIYVPQALIYHYVAPERLTLEYFAHRARFQGICDSFTHLRIRSAATEPSSLSIKPPFLSSWIRGIPGMLRSQLGRKPAPLQANLASRPWGKAAVEVHRITDAAYRQGYEFHQSEAAADPRLMRWILRDSYWGADIRSEVSADEETL
jgi:hypothetical protein